MTRVKIIKPHPDFTLNKVYYLNHQDAMNLVHAGIAQLDKSMITTDYKAKVRKFKTK